MPSHERYEELCTLAMIGEGSPDEMQDLREHFTECEDCRAHYQEFTQFLLPQLSISSENDAEFETGYSEAEKQRLRVDFLTLAQNNGMKFSQAVLQGTAASLPEQSVSSNSVPAHGDWVASVFRYRWVLGSSFALLLFAAGYGTRSDLAHREETEAHDALVPQPARIIDATRSSTAMSTSASGAAVTQLRDSDGVNIRMVAALQEKLTITLEDLQATQRTLEISQSEQASLQDDLKQKTSELALLKAQSQSEAQSATDLRSQVAQLQQRINDNQATLDANEIHIHDLNAQLTAQIASVGREKELLSVGRDVRDLMGARNLHIIDVRDSNGAGKDKPSFGRVFYTEGKSLIFYAFDLDDKKVVNADYSFEAWGERLGQPSSVKSLGVLFVDDKAQRRWSLKVDDPRQLAEINSVFVTLEPRKGDADKPHGQRILYAYLGGQPNHP